MKVLVWDAPTRAFHWLLAASFVAAWVTSEPDRYRDLHVFSGYLMLGLIALRLFWGMIGSRYARFDSFKFSPKQAWNYLAATFSGTAPRHLGHNPAGALAVYLLLISGLLVCGSGILVLGGEERHGPLAGVTGFGGGQILRQAHAALAWMMLALSALHLIGVAFESLVHRENLARAMITGNKQGEAGQSIGSHRYGAGLLLIVAVAAFAAFYFRGYAGQSEKQPYLPFVGIKLADDQLWRDECGSCHLAYHPSLLPRRSWEKLMATQQQHFGESLGIDPAISDKILAFLLKNSAENQQTEPAYKINHSIPAAATPIRITETGYWIRKHREIPQSLWSDKRVGSRANCPACHLDAEQGTFEDGAMRLPGGAAAIPARE